MGDHRMVALAGNGPLARLHRISLAAERPVQAGTNASGDLGRHRPSWRETREVSMSTTKERREIRERPYVTSFEPGVRYRSLFRFGNVFMRALLRTRLGERMRGLSILTVTGRTTGKRYAVPVSVLDLDGSEIILTASPWRLNLRGGADVEVRAGRATRRVRATLVEDPERVVDVYQRLLPTVGIPHAKRLGLVLAGNRAPTRDELLEGIRGRRYLITLAQP
jgi:F420H(2)-dependent quinone reductase